MIRLGSALSLAVHYTWMIFIKACLCIYASCMQQNHVKYLLQNLISLVCTDFFFLFFNVFSFAHSEKDNQFSYMHFLMCLCVCVWGPHDCVERMWPLIHKLKFIGLIITCCSLIWLIFISHTHIHKMFIIILSLSLNNFRLFRARTINIWWTRYMSLLKVSEPQFVYTAQLRCVYMALCTNLDKFHNNEHNIYSTFHVDSAKKKQQLITI